MTLLWATKLWLPTRTERRFAFPRLKRKAEKVIIKKTIVRKVVKPKTEDESKVAASNTEISDKEEVKDKAEIKTDKKERRERQG